MENKFILTPDGELRHYGVTGMKWGVRRDRKSGVYDERGFLTNKGHKLEKARRKKLTPEQSDAELENLYKPNKVATRHRLSAETKQFVVDGFSGKAHTPELKKAMKNYINSVEKGREVYEQRKKKIDSLTLIELGYADTKRGREIIRDYWDETFF